jgi:3-deoxy-manno-octulosonate cytidylyltransferase (CMP-KDO synthetase)
MKKVIAMIPARMGSSRFPGKPLVDLCGKTMIEHVWQRTKLCQNVDEVYILTCDKEIQKCAEGFGASVIMTSNSHERCTDRTAEACHILVNEGKDFDIVLNIQGDEPLLNPASLDLLIKPFYENDKVELVNLIENLVSPEEIKSVNVVKAIFNRNNDAIYFSRIPVPGENADKHYKQLGLYGLSKQSILNYTSMNETPLEIAESCDMLRYLEYGFSIKCALSPYVTKGVDTPEDKVLVENILRTDELFKKYL